MAEGFPNGILYDELDIEVDKLKRNFLLSSLTKKVTKIKGWNDLRSLKVRIAIKTCYEKFDLFSF